MASPGHPAFLEFTKGGCSSKSASPYLVLLYLPYRDTLYVTEVVQRQFFLRGSLCFSLVSFILGIAGLVMDQDSRTSALCRDYIIDTCVTQHGVGRPRFPGTLE